MTRKSLYTEIENAIGIKPSDHPRKNYQDAARVVWCVMRRAVEDGAEKVMAREIVPESESTREGFRIVGTGPTQAIKILWDKLDSKEVNAARTAVAPILTKMDAAAQIIAGRGSVDPVWWVADTFEAPTEETPDVPEAPTDWTPGEEAINGKTIRIPDSIESGSIADRVTKAQEIYDEVILELQDRITGLQARVTELTTERQKLEESIESITSAIRAATSRSS
jgi:hypothetical protein